MKTTFVHITMTLLTVLAVTRQAEAQGTAFTYQGRLNVNAVPANGVYDFQFSIYDSSGGGAMVAGPLLVREIGVTNGLFIALLDFGAGVFTGAERWLGIEVRPAGDGAFASLGPRQALTPTPYAMTAANLSLGASPTFTGTPSFNAPSGPPFNVSSTTKVPNLNADLLDGLDSGAFVLKSGDTMNGNLTIANPASLSFGSNVRQMVNLWGSAYGIGVQAAALYFRTDDGFAWFRDGVHATGTYDPGAGGTALMTLAPNGNLAVTATGGVALRGNASAGAAGIGVQGLAGVPFGAVPAWGVSGTAASTNSGGVFGEAMSQTTQTWGVRGRAHSSAGYGVAGENDSAFGIGVYGLNGTSGSGGFSSSSGVYGESTEPGGKGVVGVAHSGATAYGVWGFSLGGYAGQFDGAVRVNYASPFNKPQLELKDPSNSGFARLRLQTGTRPLWDIAVGTGINATNTLRFFSEGNGDVVSITPQGTLFTRVLTITGGADIAEPFEMSHPEEETIEKGAVVIIDDANPGKLKRSERAYDTRVAGVVSGAGGVRPGLTLQQEDKLDGGQHVALSGRVYVQADAGYGNIKPGDLLTTSDTPGHAMRVTEHTRAQGAVLGKAMTKLEGGKGLVLVLVTLQ